MGSILKRQQRTVGAIVRVPLENGYRSYARILEDELAFYDIYTQKEESEAYILSCPILFITMVFDDIITKGYWEKVSKAIPLEEKLQAENLPLMYRQDIITKKFELVYLDRLEPATEEQCKGLEQWSVWTAEGIEHRLNEYFTKQKEKVVIEDMELVEG